MRTEMSVFSMKDGSLVEGERTLVEIVNASADRKRVETEIYSPNGLLRERRVLIYDDGGIQTETLYYDAAGNLLHKMIRQGDEWLVYKGDGDLSHRKVTIWDETRKRVVEVRTLSSDGSVLRREIHGGDKDGKRHTEMGLDAEGKLTWQAVSESGRDGSRHREVNNYRPDGTTAGSRLTTSDASGRVSEVVETKRDGNPPVRIRETQEYDARGNATKVNRLKWNESTQRFEPFIVIYYSITYY